jgi:hypothetical protein
MTLHGERKREYQRQRIFNARAEYFVDKVCVGCGSNGPLELDHIDPRLKRFRSTAIWNMAKDNPRRVIELLNCQSLCEECHKAKSIEEMPITEGFTPYSHGTSTMYGRRGCRCSPCRAWKSSNIKRYKK